MRIVFKVSNGDVSIDISWFDILFSDCSPYTQKIEEGRYWLIASPHQSDTSFIIACGVKRQIADIFNTINDAYANEAKILDLRNEQ